MGGAVLAIEAGYYQDESTRRYGSNEASRGRGSVVG